MAGGIRTRFAAVAIAATLLSGCWTQVGFGPEHRRHNPSETGLTRDNVATLTQAWSVTVPGTTSEPIVDGDRVYTTRYNPSPAAQVGVRALNASTGATLWDTAIFTAGDAVATFGTPAALSNGKLWAGWVAATTGPVPPAAGSAITRLDPTDGSLESSDNGLFANSPAVTAGADVVETQESVNDTSTGPFTLVVRDAETLVTRWSYAIAGLTTVSIVPTVADGRVYVARDSTLYAFAVAGCGSTTCSPTWSVDLGSLIHHVTPVTGTNGQVFVMSGAGDLIAVAGSTGAELWRAPLGASSGGMALADDVLYVGVTGSGPSVTRCRPTMPTGAGQRPAVRSGPVRSRPP